MPRRKQPPTPQAFLSSTGEIAPVVSVEMTPADVVTSIKRLWLFANHYQPLTADAPKLARMIEVFLTRLSEGWRFTEIEGGAPRYMIPALRELAFNRHYRVRRCVQCQVWMFVRDPRRTYCADLSCERERSRKRTAHSRRKVKHEEEKAREAVTASRRKPAR
jgi:hypothetical protein